jgi:hypothetical protein
MKLIRSRNKDKLDNDIKKTMKMTPISHDLTDSPKTKRPLAGLDKDSWKMLIVDHWCPVKNRTNSVGYVD